MTRWEIANGRRQVDTFAQVAEQTAAFGVGGMFEETVEKKVAALDQCAIHGRPFRKNDGLAVGQKQRQCVALNDILGKDEGRSARWRIREWHFETSGVGLVHNIQQPHPTRRDVVGQEINPVKATDGQNRIAFPFLTVAAVLLINNAQLSAQHFSEKIAVATGGFEKTGFDSFAFVCDEVEHIVDQLGRRKDFAVVDDSLPGFHDEILHDNADGSIAARMNVWLSSE